MTKCRNKETGTVHDVFCFDDYFGKHRYGYQVDGAVGCFTEETFSGLYEIVWPEQEKE